MEFNKKFMIIKMFFSAKAILEFFKLFYLNFNLEQYVRKNLHINPKNLVRFCRNLAFKLVQEHFLQFNSIIQFKLYSYSNSILYERFL